MVAESEFHTCTILVSRGSVTIPGSYPVIFCPGESGSSGTWPEENIMISS